MKIATVDHDTLNYEALENPQPGDFWLERMFCPYFIVVNVVGDKFTVLSCLGGPQSFNRKDEMNAKVDNRDGTWSFDYDKETVVDKAWMSKAVKYGSIDGFVAHVTRSDRNQRIVDEWLQHKADKLIAQLKELGPGVSKYILNGEW